MSSRRLIAAPALRATAASPSVLVSRRFVEAYGSRDTDNYNLFNTQTPAVFSAMNFSDNQMVADKMVIDKRCYGIPFVIDDQRALDNAVQHHRTQIEVCGVERFMMPYWLGTTSAGGQFNAEVLQRDPSTLQDKMVWNATAPYNFSYPFDDHFPFNQIAASYVLPHSSVERTLCGTHIPSMLLSRQELREELERLKVTPKLIPFQMSTATATKLLASRVTKKRVELFAHKELKKYHGNYTAANIMFTGMVIEATRIRPVFLPLYKLMVRTIHSKTALPVYVCGATGKCEGPVISPQKHRLYGLGGVTALSTFAAGLVASPAPELCAVIAATTASIVMKLYRWSLVADAAKRVALDDIEARSKPLLYSATDEQGYKWTVEDEEKVEFHYREELRAKARKRMDFEQRVREETEREEAMRQGKAYFAKKRKVPGYIDKDPLGYYAMLGLKGKEHTATPKEIAQGFRKEAQKTHPDLVPIAEQEAAKEHMQKLVEAYTVLRDVTLRREYDSGLLTTAGAGPDKKEEPPSSPDDAAGPSAHAAGPNKRHHRRDESGSTGGTSTAAGDRGASAREATADA